MEKNRDWRKKEFEEKKKTIPGKLDHATVVAYEVGHFQPQPLKLAFHDKQRPKQQQKQSSDQKRATKPSLDQNPEFRSLLGLIK